MKFLEKDLEEVIYYNQEKCLEKGLFLNKNMKRQLRIGNYGIADLVSYERDYIITDRYCFKEKTLIAVSTPVLNIQVIELKKDSISVSAFIQAIRYARGIKSFLDKRKINNNIQICLVGKTIDLNSDICFIPNVFENVSLYTYSYGIDGITFTYNKGYILTNEGFKI